nr:non-ribosomal peptide synthetase [Lolliginicoccus lacisalsi]
MAGRAPGTLHLAALLGCPPAPGSPAITCGEHHLTHRDLEARTNRVARALARRGIGPEHIVALDLPSSIDLIVHAHAVIKAGAAYLPLDRSLPEDRLTRMLRTARPSLVVTAERAPLRFQPLPAVGPADLDDHALSSAPLDDSDRIAPLRPGNAAYVMFTSGSTGTPTAVVIPHSAIANQIAWMRDRFPLAAGATVLHKIAPTFDVSVWEIFWPLASGAHLVIAAPAARNDPDHLCALIARHSVTHAVFVPSPLRVFGDIARPRALGTLRHILVIGEELHQETVDRLASRCAATVHNLYGPTEAAVSATQSEAPASRAGAGEIPRVVPIGHPQRGVQALLLGPRLSPATSGPDVELYLGGVQLARGYLGKAALTATRFVANPWGQPGSRMYRTGDLAAFSGPTGIQFLGRHDHQVKLRGHRIELGDIEHALRRHPAVSSAVVLKRASPRGEHLDAYAALTSTAPVTVAELRDHLAALLPAHLVPARLATVASWPLTASGKLDRSALPPIRTDSDHPGGPRSRAAEDTTELEAAIAREMSEILQYPATATDSFFALGGDSLSAVRLLAGLRQHFEAPPTVEDLLRNPSPREIAAMASAAARDRTASGPRNAPPPRAPRPERIPLAPQQRRMHRHFRSHPESPMNNLIMAFRIDGQIDAALLEAAVLDVVEQHESLRTITPYNEPGPRQVVLSAEDACRGMVQYCRPDGSPLLDALRGVRDIPFDLEAQAPLRVHVLENEGGRARALALVVHHIACDGFSEAVLLRDLSTAYGARARGLEPGLQRLEMQYIDLALAQLLLLGDLADPGSVAATNHRWWHDMLAGATDHVSLLLDRPRPRSRDCAAGTHAVRSGPDVLAAATLLAARNGTTRFIVIQSILAITLAQASGSNDIVIGVPVTRRDDDDQARIVGMMIVTAPLRIRLRQGEAFPALLGRVHRSCREAFARLDIFPDALVDEHRARSAPSVSSRSQPAPSIYDVMLAYQNYPSPSLDLPGVASSFIDIPEDKARIDLQLAMHERPSAGGGTVLDIAITYATDVLDRSTIESLGARLLHNLARFCMSGEADSIDLARPLSTQKAVASP